MKSRLVNKLKKDRALAAWFAAYKQQDMVDLHSELNL